MWDESTLPARDRPNAFVVGKLLYEGNIPRAAALESSLLADLEVSAAGRFKDPPVLTEAFLRILENEPSWHDADKLAFRDAVAALSGRLDALAPDSPAGRALQTRLNEDRRALEEILARYQREMDRVFAQFETRGMPIRREAWESYLAFLRTLTSAQALMDAHREAVVPLVAPQPAPPEKLLSGSRLPDKTLVLTFDDGPHPTHTGAVLEVLGRFGLQAIFYQVGQNLGRIDEEGRVTESAAAAWSRKVLAAGNLVGNHTVTHPCLTKLTAAEVVKELEDGSALIRAVDGVGTTLFRPPYGAISEPVRCDAELRAMKTMMWSIDSLDWADPVPTSIANRVIGEAKAKGRGVVLFHDIHSRAAEALPAIVETLQAEGFRFVLWDGTQILDRGGATPATPAKSAPPALKLYGESWAVVVGINDYAKWPKLTYAVADALAVRDLLINEFAFKPENVTVLLNGEATRERILSALGDRLGDTAKVHREDRVLVFFAGHGATRQLPSGRSLGYIIPAEADAANYQGQAISMTNFRDIDEVVPAKHILYVMDACYSGLALVRGGTGPSTGGPQKYLAEATRRPARQMLTAGGADQAVADSGPGGHSIFTWTLLQGLQGKADLNGDGYIPASELFAYAGPAVSALSQQTPAFGNLVGSEGGDFVFELAHRDEFLSQLSDQLDEEGLRLTAQLDGLRREIAEKRARNLALSKEVASAEREAEGLGGRPPSGSAPDRARAALDRGLALYREKRYEEALGAFQEAYDLTPSNAQVANNIGFVHFRMGEAEKALAWYERTLALDPGRAVAWANRGEVLESLGRGREAAESYRRLLELSPGHPSAAFVRRRLAALDAVPR